MREIIAASLDEIENTHAVKILLACESGSRAWGFPSRDSDYDVRFIYAHPTDWYLTIARKRGVIELPIDEDLDINGWDLHKALQLLRKSNSPLLEWLSSPIRYRAREDALDLLTALSKKAFMPESSCHHYLAMARSSLARLREKATARIKTYMYALRPVLCCDWIIRHGSQPPMCLDALLPETVSNYRITRAVGSLVEIKKGRPEEFEVDRSEEIENFLLERIADLETRIPKNSPPPAMEAFDRVFRQILTTLRGEH